MIQIPVIKQPVSGFGRLGSMLLHVQSRLDAPQAVVAVTGEMDMSNAELVKAEILQAATSDCTEVTLDLSEVSFIDSVCLGMLVGCNKKLSDLGGSLQIVTCNAMVLKMFTLTRLDQVFGVIDPETLQETVA